MIYYKEVDFLPDVPQELINSLEEIESFENVFPYPESRHTYASYKVPRILQNYLQEFFDYPVIVRYQIIRKNLPIHVDVGIKGIKYNYILDTGGENVLTKFWDSVDNPGKKLFEVKIKQRFWHYLNIETPHSVVGVEQPRISITVREKK